ncbi:hypothetical protein H4R34_000754 [Dimargaris verticillata]|uniref:Sterol regulatory element-binding protein cleavage-activating protein n=1 Tax=Dimargaris verticillata TaxID=2761393 RepID=A0A9W8EFM3_9FUNG|nr:hypothetical protein H4R34_000754 [Dimargaris verticillata]
MAQRSGESPQPYGWLPAYFYHHGRFIAAHSAAMLVLTCACLAVLILPPLYQMAWTTWTHRRLPYTFTPISSYIHDAKFFARVAHDPMLVWQTVHVEPTLSKLPGTPSNTPPDTGPLQVLTTPFLYHTQQFQHLLQTTTVTTKEIRRFVAAPPAAVEGESSTSLAILSDDTTFSLADICYKPNPQSECLIVSPLVYWHDDREALLNDPLVEQTVYRHPHPHYAPAHLDIPTAMLWRTHIVHNTLGASGPRVTAEGASLSVAAVETWQRTIPTRFILRALIAKAALALNTTHSCTPPASCLPSPQVSLAGNHFDRIFRAHFEPDYHKFSLEHYALALGCLALLLYIFYSFRRLDFVKSKFWLGFATLLMLACSICLALSICASLSRPHLLLPWEVMAFFIFIIVVENVHAITHSVVGWPFDLPVKERIGRGLASVGPTIVTRLALELGALSLGATMSSTIIREFCLFLILVLIIDFGFQITFFTTVLSIDIRRLELADIYSKRHTATPYPTPPNPVSHPLGSVASASANPESAPWQWLGSMLRAPPLVLRSVHRHWLRHRLYSVMVVAGFVGFLYVLYGHTSHAVNIIFPAHEDALIYHAVFQATSSILGQLVRRFHSVEILTSLTVRYHLSLPTHASYLQPSVGTLTTLPPHTCSSVVCTIRTALEGWLIDWWLVGVTCIGIGLFVIVVARALCQRPASGFFADPLRRLMIRPLVPGAGPGRSTAIAIDYARIATLDPQLPTDIALIQVPYPNRLLLVSDDGSLAWCALLGTPTGDRSLSPWARWRALQRSPSDIYPALVAHDSLQHVLGAQTNTIAVDQWQHWTAAFAENGQLTLWYTTHRQVIRASRPKPTSESRPLCLDFAYRHWIADQWVLHRAVLPDTKPLDMVLCVGHHDGQLELLPVPTPGTRWRSSPLAVCTLAEPIVQVCAVNNLVVCCHPAGAATVVACSAPPLPLEGPTWPTTSPWPTHLTRLYRLTGISGRITQIATTAACPRLVIAGTTTGAVAAWDVATGALLKVLSHGAQPREPARWRCARTKAWPPRRYEDGDHDAQLLCATPGTQPSSFNVPSPITTLDPTADCTILGSGDHRRPITRVLIKPDYNALKNVERIFVVTASMDERVHIWQLTMDDYGEPLPPIAALMNAHSSAHLDPTLHLSRSPSPPAHVTPLSPLVPLQTDGSPHWPRSHRRRSWHRLPDATKPDPGPTSDLSPLPLTHWLHLLSVFQPGCTTVTDLDACLIGARQIPLADPYAAPITEQPVPATTPWSRWWKAPRTPHAAQTSTTSVGRFSDLAVRSEWSLWVVRLSDLRASDHDPRRQQLDHQFAVQSLPLARPHEASGPAVGSLPHAPWLGYSNHSASGLMPPTHDGSPAYRKRPSAQLPSRRGSRSGTISPASGGWSPSSKHLPTSPRALPPRRSRSFDEGIPSTARAASLTLSPQTATPHTAIVDPIWDTLEVGARGRFMSGIVADAAVASTHINRLETLRPVTEELPAGILVGLGNVVKYVPLQGVHN